MKKSLLALAVLGAVAGVAQAQSAVTIYGIVDMGIVRETGAVGTVPSNVTRLNSVASGSRIGFRGVEDLGNGLQGIFVIENGFNPDTGTLGQGGRFFGRQAFVGLKSNNFGTVSLGRQQNIARLALLDFDPFALGLTGTSGNVMRTYGDRTDNSIKYATPVWGGFVAEVLYGAGEIAGGESEDGRSYGGSVGYTNGPIGVKLIHQALDTTTPTVAGGLAKTTALFGSYNFGVAKLSAGYADNDGSLVPGGPETERRDGLLGLTVPFGATTLLASWIRSDDRVADNDADQYALGLVYKLSKRTNFYTSYTRISNDAAATFRVGNGSGAGTGDTAFAVGVRHSF
jgi:predicted porin